MPEGNPALIERSDRLIKSMVEQKSKDKGLCRRLTAILMVYAALKITEIAEHLCAARSFVGCWINLFIQIGEIGLMTRKPSSNKGYSEKLIQKMLRVLVESSPQVFGWSRSRWSVE
ncbi:helix-turn-helix domain-containing protein [Salmonella enterica]|uniref:Helix-turn-helix domain-containing protein n=1 Tax=Salmonella enterica TaxID=28901 RepID=A0A5U0QWH0_SALER|nr:helix-turn-helix domain-containing protein [Salmonella enterica]ECT8456500.1 helix-turn-helix domain-containing protein [Salmonella enterica subsp. enterica serovar Panama]EAT1700017.1 helix-turn-helix domain-containing protein [Salmonella enterica]EAT3611180.1 helix-turn-helix domain-containing protein [Salmonella enterica]EBL6762549.1 helix-turn-helix domain-containing protein [Salmonella enterica]